MYAILVYIYLVYICILYVYFYIYIKYIYRSKNVGTFSPVSKAKEFGHIQPTGGFPKRGIVQVGKRHFFGTFQQIKSNIANIQYKM